MDKGSRKEQTIIVKIICLLLSFGLWLYVSNVENPVRTHEIKDIPVEILNEELKEDYDLDEMSDDELFEEYISLSEEMAVELQDDMPKHSLVNAISYKWDNSENVIKTVFAVAYIGLGQLKLNDVSRRLLNELD